MAIRAVHAYLARTGAASLVVPMHQTSAGIYFEASNPIKLQDRLTPENIGVAFRMAFDSFTQKEKDLRQFKVTDAPSFKASGCRSVMAFESEYVLLACYGTNDANALVRASAAHPTYTGVEVSVVFNPLAGPLEVGEQLLLLFSAANDA